MGSVMSISVALALSQSKNKKCSRCKELFSNKNNRSNYYLVGNKTEYCKYCRIKGK